MTAMKPVLELYIDANILLLLAFCLWRAAGALVVGRALKDDYRRQLALLKTVLVLTVLSPALAYGAVLVSTILAPTTPMTFSDIAVAVFLEGDIALPAADFQSLLSFRANIVDGFLAGEIPWLSALFVVLVAGVAVHAARTVGSFLLLRKAFAGSYVWRTTGRTDLRFSDDVEMPFAARGWRRRHVVLPSALMTEPEELRVVLAHEFQHLRSGDVEWEVAFEILRPLFFWNPAFTLWKRAFDQLRELSCDQAVLMTRNVSPEAYAKCLLDFCERRLNRTMPRAMNVAFVRTAVPPSRTEFESRVLAVFRTPGGGGRMALGAAIFAMLLAVTLAAASVRKPGDWSHDRIMLSTIVNLERLEAINQGASR